MSDEEDGVDNEAGSWVVRSPPWRSPQLSSLLRRLQEKVDTRPSSSSHPKNPRVQGPPSTRPPPPSSPAWTVNSNKRHSHQRTRTPSPSSFLATPSPPPQPTSPTCSQGEDYGEEDLLQARPSSSSHAKTARVQGSPSTRPHPPSSPAWTVNSNRRQGHQRTHTPSPSSFPVTSSPPPQSPSPTWSQGEEYGDENLLHTEDIWRVLDQDPPVRQHRRRRRAFVQESDSES